MSLSLFREELLFALWLLCSLLSRISVVAGSLPVIFLTASNREGAPIALAVNKAQASRAIYR